MHPTVQSIVDRANGRVNPNNNNSVGQVTRADILEVLEVYKDATNEITNVQEFLDALSFVTTEMKDKILSDIPSYWSETTYREDV